MQVTSPANKPNPPHGQQKKKEEAKPPIDSTTFTATAGVVSDPYKFEAIRGGDVDLALATEVKITRHGKVDSLIGNSLTIQVEQIPRFIAALQEMMRNILPKLNDYGRPAPPPSEE